MRIVINNEEIKLIKYQCTPTLIEVGDSVMTLDGVNHVEGRKIKRNIDATTIDLIRVDAYRLLNVLKNTYVTVLYQDPLTDKEETRIFILQNNPELSMKMWKNGKEFYEGIKIELLEKGAE